MNISNKTCKTKLCILAAGTLLVFGLIACAGIREPQSNASFVKAQAIFSQHCKEAGEKIFRTVDGVEGLYVLKLRAGMNLGDQFKVDDPYGNDLFGDGYIKGFLRSERDAVSDQAKPSTHSSYLYVDAIDPKDGRRYRYTGYLEEPWQRDKSYLKGYILFSIKKSLAQGDAPRYGVTYDDISTPEDREHWIAGSSLKVIDLQKNEVIAERRGYMMDPGQGDNSGGRAPWLHAANNSCPPFLGPHAASDQIGQTKRFVRKVLKPMVKQGE